MLKDYSHLHSTCLIDNNKCRVWHKSQERSCARCRHTDHATVNTEKCDAYIEEQDVITIHLSKNVLCNYYMYPLKVFNTQFISAEHAYQWRFMMYIGRDDHAHDILYARTPAEAKEITSRIPGYLHKDWYKIKLTVMKGITCKGGLLPTFQICLN